MFVYQTLPFCLWLSRLHLRLQSCSPTQNLVLDHSHFFSGMVAVADQRKGEIMFHYSNCCGKINMNGGTVLRSGLQYYYYQNKTQLIRTL